MEWGAGAPKSKRGRRGGVPLKIETISSKSDATLSVARTSRLELTKIQGESRLERENLSRSEFWRPAQESKAVGLAPIEKKQTRSPIPKKLKSLVSEWAVKKGAQRAGKQMSGLWGQKSRSVRRLLSHLSRPCAERPARSSKTDRHPCPKQTGIEGELQGLRSKP